jgi:ABC-2 type transport system permease protein
LKPNRLYNVALIAKREYLERIRTRAFLIATILIPCVLGGLGFGSGYLAQRTKSEAHIAIVSSDAAFAADLRHELENGKDSHMRVELEAPSPATLTRLNATMRDSSQHFAGFLQIIPAAAPGARPGFSYSSHSASDIGTISAIKDAISAVLTRESLIRQGIPAADTAALMAPIHIDTPQSGDTTTAFFGAYLFFILMYMAIMLYGMNTARSIIEEKSSRVFEVLLSTITPDEMLAGKILGVGAVGLTQIAIWMLAALLIGVQFAGAIAGSGGHAVISPMQAFFFVAYFIFGFLLYSSIAAALGAMTNSEQELQQLNLFLVMPLAFCMLMLFSIVKSPDSTLSRVISLIPFCSPLLMNFRISIGAPQLWEVLLSFVLMGLTIFVILWFASRIYRVGILMYGKKPNLPEILRWLKYS